MYRIKVPATSANLGPGFDSLGLAVELYNTFVFKERSNGCRITLFDQRAGREITLPHEENLVYQAMERAFALRERKLKGIELIEEINIPLARGLGSSASAVIAGLVGANFLLEQSLTEQEIISLATEIEGHPDNVLPAFKGGLIINVMTEQGPIYQKVEVQPGIELVFVIPDFKLKTEDLRQVLPTQVSYADALFNHSRTALLTACFYSGDLDKLAVAMEDRLHQDYRSPLIPGFKEVIRAGYRAGAAGVALSGAGPAILAIVVDGGKKELIAERMLAVFARYGVSGSYICTKPNNQGVFMA